MCFSLKSDKPNILATCVGLYQAWPSTFTVDSSVSNYVLGIFVVITFFLLVIIYTTRLGFIIVVFSIDPVSNRITFSNVIILLSSVYSPLLLLVSFQLLGYCRIHWSGNHSSCFGFLILINSCVKWS